MTDREMVEKAARAMGWTDAKWSDLGWLGEHRYGFTEALFVPEIESYWNPLSDDGQALRLAVKLGIQIGDAHQYGPALAHTDGRLPFAEYWEPVIEGDIYAATRRAITRAAAAIQEAKEGV